MVRRFNAEEEEESESGYSTASTADWSSGGDDWSHQNDEDNRGSHSKTKQRQQKKKAAGERKKKAQLRARIQKKTPKRNKKQEALRPEEEKPKPETHAQTQIQTPPSVVHPVIRRKPVSAPAEASLSGRSPAPRRLKPKPVANRQQPRSKGLLESLIKAYFLDRESLSGGVKRLLKKAKEEVLGHGKKKDERQTKEGQEE